MKSNPYSLLVNPGVEWCREILQKVRRKKLGKQMKEENNQIKPSTPGVPLAKD